MSSSTTEMSTPRSSHEDSDMMAEKSPVNDLEGGEGGQTLPTKNDPDLGVSGPDPNIPPDGGLHAWLTVAGGFCTVFASLGWINCIGVFQTYYQTHQLASYSPDTVAWIPSTESFMLFFFGLFSGKMVDSIGPRWPILIGSFLHIFGLMMVSISQEYYQFFLAQSVCSAIGTSFLFYPTLAAAGTWFKKRRAFAFGIITAGSSVGGVILPIMVQRLIPEIGFAWAMRTTAFFLLALLVFGNLTIRSRLTHIHKPFAVKPDYLTPFTELPFLLTAVGGLFIYFGGFLPFNFIILQAQSSGMSTELSQYLVPILNAASTFGRVIPGYAGDIYGVYNICILFTLISGIFTLALWLPAASNAPIIVYAIIYGFSSGLTLSIIPAMVARISDVRQLGVRTGTLYAFTAVGVLTGSPIAGAIQSDQHGSYSGMIVFCGVTLLVGTGFMVAARIAKAGPGWKTRF